MLERVLRPVPPFAILLAAAALAASVAPVRAQGAGPRELPDDALRLEQSALAHRMSIADPVRGQMVNVFVRGTVSPGALSAMGAEVNTVAGDVITARMPLAMALDVRRMAGVEAVRLATPLQLDNDLAVPDAHANNKRTQSPPLLGFNGNQVVVGFVDSGIEYQHDDFKNPDGTTRLLSIWDQTVATVSPPSGFSYGREWTQAQINAATCSEVDPVGHGTHVAGIAVGDGSATGNAVPQFKYTGMANKAAIVTVKTDFTDTGLLDAVNYIFQKAFALGWPAVVNLSLSTNLGPHDGSSDLELGLNALIGPGKVIVASGGNNFGLKKHARLTSTGSANDSTTINIPAYTGTPSTDFFLADGYYESTDNYRIQVKSPSGIVFGPVNKGAAVIPPGNVADPKNADGRVYIENGVLLSNSGDPNVYIEVSDLGGTPKPKNGNWVVTVIPVSVASAGKVDFWSYSGLTNPGAAPASETFATRFTDDMTLGSPSMADSVICVAAHVTRASWTAQNPPGGTWSWGQTLNAIGTFSSSGPRRDNVMKPDISAPGSAIASALSTAWVATGSAGGWDARYAVDDGKHAVQQGTSMSSPMVAGAVAMMLQQQPTMGPKLARQRLTTNARVDANVTAAGAVPNKRFGAGKLDLTNVLPNVDTIAPNTTLTAPNGGEAWAPSSQHNVTWTASDNIGVTGIDLAYTTDNGLNWNPIVNGIANSGTYLWTVPNSPTTQARVRVTAHDTQNQTSDQSNALFTIGTNVGVEPTAFSFSVARPSPSPFTTLTSIAFELPSAAAASGTWPTTVRIYNIAGRLVRNVIQADMTPGPHTAAWDGSDEQGVHQPAGVYFVEVATPQHRAQVRAVYLR
jgi:hypothetical protein